jgi:hypothetical protein
MNTRVFFTGLVAGGIVATLTGTMISFGNSNLATAQMDMGGGSGG